MSDRDGGGSCMYVGCELLRESEIERYIVRHVYGSVRLCVCSYQVCEECTTCTF